VRFQQVRKQIAIHISYQKPRELTAQPVGKPAGELWILLTVNAVEHKCAN